MKRYLIKFAYDGTRFEAFVAHKGKRTVEGTILKQLRLGKVIQNPERNHYKSASRTDKGVSALGNAIAFDSNMAMQDIMDAMSGMDGIWVWGIAKVKSDFNPVRAKNRWYRYYLPATNPVKMASEIERIGRIFIGTHNFLGYSTLRDQKRSICTIFDFKASSHDGFVVIDLLGKSYLYNQIRRMIGSILDVIDGKRKEGYIQELLKGRSDAVKTIATRKLIDPDGLVLMDVSYRDVKIIPWKSSIVKCIGDIEAKGTRRHGDTTGKYAIADIFCDMFEKKSLALKPEMRVFNR